MDESGFFVKPWHDGSVGSVGGACGLKKVRFIGKLFFHGMNPKAFTWC